MIRLLNSKNSRLTSREILLLHLVPGVIITVFYILVAPGIVKNGYPSLIALLAAELFILAPVELIPLYRLGFKINNKLSLNGILLYTNRIKWKVLIKYGVGGILLCFILYIPLYPIGALIRENLFSWLPDWYFDPGFDRYSQELLIKAFASAVIIDGIVGAGVEELYFRGYLLPRMQHLGKWAPAINAFLFTIYHFWQPMNYLGIFCVGLIIAYATWKTKSIWVALFIHCGVNIIGNGLTLLAVMSGNL